MAAAGNDALDVDLVPYYPASFELDDIVSVAATTRSDELVGYSNFGATNVDLAAPGTNICSTDFQADDASAMDEGTSMSAAYVSGAFALVLARYAPETYRQIISRVLSGADSLPALSGISVAGGRLNLQRAMGLPPRLAVIPTVGGGPFQLQLSGDPNRAYVILETTNLLTWSPIFTNVTGTNGEFIFEDHLSTNLLRRFYRAVRLP